MIFSIILVIICALLIGVVLIQNSKGGGIQSQFSAANQIMGIRRGTDFIEKTTWTLAILLLVFSLLMSPKTGSTDKSAGSSSSSVTKKKASTAVPVQQAPMMQQAPPQQGQGQQLPPGHSSGDGHNHP